MAVDTRGKRASVLSYDAEFIFPLVPADGTIGQRDRQHALWSYAALMGAVSIGPSLRVADWMRPDSRAAERLRPESRHSEGLVPALRNIDEA